MAKAGIGNPITVFHARWLAAALATAVAFAAQTSLFGNISLWGIRPDLVLVVVVAYGLHYGPAPGAVLGLVAGFFVDVYGGRLIGMGGLAKLTAGAVAGLIGETVFRERALVWAAVTGAGSIVANGVYLLLARAFGLEIPVGLSISRVIAPSALCDTAAGFFLYPLLAHVFELSDQRDERRRLGRAED